MAWAWWLAMPVAATALASMLVWWRARPERVPTAGQAMRAHRDYLDALVFPARGAARTAPAAGPVPERAPSSCAAQDAGTGQS